LKIAIDRESGNPFGIRAGTLAADLEIALNGEVVSQFLENQKIHDVFVRLDDESRSTPEKISDTLIKFMPNGKPVMLKDVANVYEGTGPNMVNREDMQRRIVVSANTEGRDLGAVVKDVRLALDKKIRLPEGYFIKIGGQFESQQSASRRIFWLGLVSLLGIFLVLFIHFRSVVLSLQVMLNVPLALIGSIIAIFITEGVLSIATLIAFITLCGISSRNGILLISHYLHLMKEEGENFDSKMVIRGSLERLVPVLMTACTAGLALVPLLLSKGEPGKEILYPVAVVIVGGLISSTLLDLVVTPTVFLKYGKNAFNKYMKHQHTTNLGEWK
jgi:Cu/Ag efflux pump CusA